MEGISQQLLIFHHYLHQFSQIGWWWRRGWIHINMISAMRNNFTKNIQTEKNEEGATRHQ
jgi:hypothetical protein